jgi:hypothetical protein
MNYKPPVDDDMLGPYRPPDVRKQVVEEPETNGVDMYSWLLEKLVKKCNVAGMDAVSSGVVSVMTEIIKLAPEKTEDVTKAMVEHLRHEADVDLVEFLNYFSDEDTLKNRLGDKVYANLFKAHSSGKVDPLSDMRSYSSEFSYLPSPSKVDYTVVHTHARPGPAQSTETSATTHPKTQSSSYSSFSVPSALKLKWSNKARAVSASTVLNRRVTEMTESVSNISEQRTRQSSAATKVSLTIPSESTTVTITPSEESTNSSVGDRLDALRSPLMDSSTPHAVLSLNLKSRPSSATLASVGTKSMKQTSLSTKPYVATLLTSTCVLTKAEHMIKEVLMRPWFPKAYRRGATPQATIDNVFDGLRECSNRI